MDDQKKALRDALVMNLANRGSQWIINEYRARRNWTVSIESGDDLYFPVHNWIMKQEDNYSPRHAVTVKSQFEYGLGTERKRWLQFVFDGDEETTVMVNGHEVIVSMNDGDSSNEAIPSAAYRVLKPARLYFRAKSRAGRDAVIDLMNELHQSKHEKEFRPALNVYSKYGDWTKRSDLPARTLESVIVKGDVVNKLYEDLLDFRNREQEYNRRGIPYHRAYLLTGPPGCGKTSSVKAVTQALGLDLWYAQLSELEKDTKLVDMLSDVNAGGILLLEDIDSFSAATARTDEKDKVSASGLLNALDGVATPHGLVTILTTNHPEKLDPALVRPGRVDQIIKFENPDSDTIHRHFQFFYGHHSQYVGEWSVGLSSAAVSEIFKRHIDDPVAAERELLQS